MNRLPLLTIALPQWKVLPDWAASPVRKTVADSERAWMPAPRILEPTATPILREQPAMTPALAPDPVPPSAFPVASGPLIATPEISLPEPVPANARVAWLGLGWLLGFIFLAPFQWNLRVSGYYLSNVHLLDRTVRELFATRPTAEEIAEFVADESPGAFDSLVKRLATRAGVVSFSGHLEPAPVTVRVLAETPASEE